jgi:hypothetical protein
MEDEVAALVRIFPDPCSSHVITILLRLLITVLACARLVVSHSLVLNMCLQLIFFLQLLVSVSFQVLDHFGSTFLRRR